MAILACDRSGQSGYELCRGLARYFLEAACGYMVTLVNDQVSILSHQVVNHPFADQALDHRHIDQTRWPLLTTSDPADGFGR